MVKQTKNLEFSGFKYAFELTEGQVIINAVHQRTKRCYRTEFTEIEFEGGITIPAIDIYQHIECPLDGVEIEYPSELSTTSISIIVTIIVPMLGKRSSLINLIEIETGEVARLRMRVEDLENELETARTRKGQVVNITAFIDSTERQLSNQTEITMFEFNLEKIQEDSTLILQGTMSLHGQHNAESGYRCVVGDKVIPLQPEGYSNNSGYARAVPITAIMENIPSGNITVKIVWSMRNNASGRPANFINPSGSQHTQLNACHSHFSITEIL